ncbi:PA14 domain-containing protein [Hymenobacter metallicola]|uniref:T9SS type A sorting domain-containing protein n=1 Tax=Hymenobacter metallicola TaxID=2563114 RepID=A0A4Z0QF72_9BACT|nr:PA14 domain-containing protein [Hymenobacter metallicola]TGE28670.1 T9SS type A sorting domain-containing protein [Hymenobacter metallicola]
MKKFLSGRSWPVALLCSWLTGAAYGQITSEQRVPIVSATPSVATGQDYSPWLNDDPASLLQDYWMPANFQYIDVTLRLSQPTELSRLSLLDYQGAFPDRPATLYALSGNQRTLLGTFDGAQYNQWVDLPVAGSLRADAIVIHKYCNNVPAKIRVFGRSSGGPSNPVPATISFAALPALTVGGAAVPLTATSTNPATPILFSSANAGVATVAQVGGQWQLTPTGAGTTTITATQAGSSAYQPATAAQTLVVHSGSGGGGGGGNPTAGKIPLEASRWYQLNNVGNGIAALFDGSTSTGATTGWGKILPTFDAYYPLHPGETISLESLRFFDGEGSNPQDPMTLSVITDTWQRIPVASFTGGQYNQWVGPDPGRPNELRLPAPISNIRYLVLTASWAYPTEIELYGSYVPGTPPPAPDAQTLAQQKQIRLRQQLGVNAFEWDLEDPNRPWEIDETRLAAAKNFTGIRHYLDWEKLELTEGNYTFNPVHRGGWNYDVLYQRLKAEGIEVLACLKTLPPWLLETYPGAERDLENVPVRYGRDFADPRSYVEQAKVGFQFIARYGYNTAVDPALVRVTTSTRWPGDGVNQARIGLGLIRYIECENERDKWWKGRKAYQTGREYAANLSAFYDGHKNTMGPGVGVKNADPTVQVVMAGLASPSPDYVRGMIDWCREFRGLRADGSVNLCWDVINYHLYSNDARSSQNGNSTRGAAPEVSEAAQVARDFVRMAHQYAGGMPVWITETGYDVNQGSPLKAVAIGNRSVLETQADWTLRTALLYARWGVERVFFYQMYDDNPGSTTQFASSGLINQNKTPKPAADFLRQAGQLLGEYTYKATQSQDPLVDRYQKDGSTAYALVVPDEKGRTASYTLELGTDSARIYQPRAGQPTMSLTRVRTQGGRLTLTVTETPLFVVAGSGGGSPPPPNVCSGTGAIQWEQWTGVGGTSVAAIPTQTSPNTTTSLSRLESPRDVGDNFGARMRGFICPPQSGNYTFRLSGDDDCELWLSPDDNPAHKVRIAGYTGYTDYGQWDKYATQQATPVSLQAGRRYYVEVLHKEAGGRDFVAVGWQLPNGQWEAPVSGSHLIPFSAPASRPAAGQAAATAAQGADSHVGSQAALSVYPNPFAEQTRVTVSLPTAGAVQVLVVDAQNRLVRRLFDGRLGAGEQKQFSLASEGLPNGLYVVQLVTKGKVVTQKLSLLR